MEWRRSRCDFNLSLASHQRSFWPQLGEAAGSPHATPRLYQSPTHSSSPPLIQHTQVAHRDAAALVRAGSAAGRDKQGRLTVQEATPEQMAAADAAASKGDDNPNFSANDGTSSSSGGKDPFLSAELLLQHIE